MYTLIDDQNRATYTTRRRSVYLLRFEHVYATCDLSYHVVCMLRLKL